MKVLSVQTIGALGIEDGTYSFAKGAGEADDLVLVTGPEAAGKTRLLEVILGAREVLAPSGADFDAKSWVRIGDRCAKAIVTWMLSPEERKSIGAKGATVETEIIFDADPSVAGKADVDPGFLYLLDHYQHRDESPKVEYFAENRRLDTGGGSGSIEVSTQKALRTAKEPRKYAWVPEFLRSLAHAEHSALRVQKLLAALSSSLGYDADKRTLSAGGAPVTDLAKLSASEADALIFATTAALVRLSRSIVFVDRPELFGDGVRILQALPSLGSDNQLIVATNAPDAIAAAKGHATIILDPSRPPR